MSCICAHILSRNIALFFMAAQFENQLILCPTPFALHNELPIP